MLVQNCPSCATEIPADAPRGLCPKCLLQAGLQGSLASQGGAEPGAKLGALPSVEEIDRLFPTLHVLERVGRGGMGVVYLARDESERAIALKILAPELAGDAGFTERFAREARAVARLEHPNIVDLYGFGEVGGLSYLLLEYVEGQTLRQALADGPLEAERGLDWLGQVLQALVFAHGQGVVHRDLKPENVLVGNDGRVRLVDFGLAKLTSSTHGFSLTGTRQVLGTPHYMAPEQLESPDQVDERADVFGFGVLAYETLTGRLPLGRFNAPSHYAKLSPGIGSVILACLEREPDDRPADAKALWHEWQSACAGRHVATRRLSAGELLGRYRVEHSTGDRRYRVTAGGETFDLELALPDLRERFQERERLVGERLPHLVTLVDLGVDADTPYAVYREAPGPSLADRRLSPEEALEAAIAATKAVVALHARGVSLRAIRPENLHWGLAGEIELRDGEAEADLISPLGPDEGAETMVATWLRFAPEVSGSLVWSKAKVPQAGERADVWALGATYCQLITGSEPPLAPEGDEDTQRLRAILGQAHEEFCVPDGLPRRVQQVLRRALQPDPALRYSCAKHLLADLEALQEGRALPSNFDLRHHLKQDPRYVLEFLQSRLGKRALKLAAVALGLLVLLLGLAVHSLRDRAARRHASSSAGQAGPQAPSLNFPTRPGGAARVFRMDVAAVASVTGHLGRGQLLAQIAQITSDRALVALAWEQAVVNDPSLPHALEEYLRKLSPETLGAYLGEPLVYGDVVEVPWGSLVLCGERELRLRRAAFRVYKASATPPSGVSYPSRLPSLSYLPASFDPIPLDPAFVRSNRSVDGERLALLDPTLEAREATLAPSAREALAATRGEFGFFYERATNRVIAILGR